MTPTQRHNLLRGLIILTALSVVMLMASIASGGEIQLKRTAHVASDPITLGDIAELTGDDALALKDIPIARFSDVGPKLTVSLDGLRDTLDMHQVNWGRVSIRGFTECTVIEQKPEPAETQKELIEIIDELPAADKGLTAGANLDHELSVEVAASLRERVDSFIAGFVGLPAEQVRITHAPDDLAALDEPRYGAFSFQSTVTEGSLGRLPITVFKVSKGTVEPVLRLAPTVERVTLAAVAVRKVNKGQTFTSSDVRIEEVTITHASRKPVLKLNQLVGRVAGSTIRAGQAVMLSDIQSPILINRGDMVTVKCVVGGVMLKTTARAAEDGGADDLITVKNIGSRDAYVIRVTGRREGAVVNKDSKPIARK